MMSTLSISTSLVSIQSRADEQTLADFFCQNMITSPAPLDNQLYTYSIKKVYLDKVNATR